MSEKPPVMTCFEIEANEMLGTGDYVLVGVFVEERPYNYSYTNESGPIDRVPKYIVARKDVVHVGLMSRQE